MKKITLAIAIASTAFAAQAQKPIGMLQDVSGTVSVSGKSVVSRAVSGTPINDGSSILVSSSGKATLVLQNGCSISLGANQHLTVDAKTPCELVTASVKHLFPAYKVAQAPLGSLPPPPPPFFAAGLSSFFVPAAVFTVGGLAAANSTNSNNPVSGQ